MLDLPREVDAQPGGEFDLRECILKQLQLAPLVPGPRQLMLVKDAELHPSSPFGSVRCAVVRFAAVRCVARALVRRVERLSWPRRSRTNCRSNPLILASMRRSSCCTAGCAVTRSNEEIGRALCRERV